MRSHNNAYDLLFNSVMMKADLKSSELHKRWVLAWVIQALPAFLSFLLLFPVQMHHERSCSEFVIFQSVWNSFRVWLLGPGTQSFFCLPEFWNKDMMTILWLLQCALLCCTTVWGQTKFGTMQAGHREEKQYKQKLYLQVLSEKKTTYDDMNCRIIFISDYFRHTCPPTFQNRPDINIMLHSINGKINLITK